MNFIRNLFKNLFVFAKRKDGQAMVEFALVFPVQLFVTLGVLQWALLYIGQEVVAYSAFCAARAAIVEDNPDNAAQRAAQIACIPVAGTSVDGDLEAFEGLPTPIGDLDRGRASIIKTSVAIIEPPGSGRVTVEVSHNFELVVPVVNYFPFSAVTYFGEPGNKMGDVPHTLIKQRCTIVEP